MFFAQLVRRVCGVNRSVCISCNFCAGITTKAHAHGLKVTAILKGTDADGSDLVPGDVITIVGDAILVGLPLHLAEEKLAGPRCFYSAYFSCSHIRFPLTPDT